MSVKDSDIVNQHTTKKADEIKELIGSCTDTGGTSSAGSIFAKLNKIISDIANHVANWTATRAGYIDTIKTNTDSTLAKLNNDVAGVTSQTKQFTELIKGTLTNSSTSGVSSPVTIYGKGRLIINSSYATVKIDNNEPTSLLSGAAYCFEEKVTINTPDRDRGITYYIQT